jgi:hypothetical protein
MSIIYYLRCGIFVILMCYLVACKDEPRLVLAEGIAKSDSEVNYRLVIMTSTNRRIELINLQEPVQLINSTGHDISYIDGSGVVWTISLIDRKPIKLVDLGHPVQEDVIGKYLLKKKEHRLFYIENRTPSKQNSSDSIYSLNCISFDGNRSTLFTGNGKAFSMQQLSKNTFLLSTSQGMLNIDISTGKYKRLLPYISKTETVLLFDKYIVNQHYDDHYIVDVIENISGNKQIILNHQVNNGFGIVADFDPHSKELLLIEVSKNQVQNRLVIIAVGHRTGTELYRSDIIGSASFLKDVSD